MRLENLTPDNMFSIYHSQLVKKEKEANLEIFKQEKWYSVDFTVETLTDEFKA